jgi:hypothetical protein
MNPKSMILSLRKKGAHCNGIFDPAKANPHHMYRRIGAFDSKNLPRRRMGVQQASCYV